MIRRFLATFVLLGLLAGALPAAASPSQDLQKVSRQIDRLEAQIRDGVAQRSDLARRVKETKARRDELTAQIADTDTQIQALQADLAHRRAMLDAIRRGLQATYRSLVEARSERAQAEQAAKDWARDAYMQAGAQVGTIAFSASQVTDVLVGLEYLDRSTADRRDAMDRWAAVAAREQALQDRAAAAEAAARDELAAIAGTQSRLAADLDKLAAQRSELESELTSQEQLLAEVEKALAEWNGELTRLQKEQASIRRIIAERSRPRSPRHTGRYYRPVPGAVTSGFGPRVHPIYGVVKMHTGVDMHAPMGQPISAFASGRVIFAGVKGGYGNAVMIDHGGGMVTLYAHQSKIAVRVGQRVKGGQVIGYVGSTGLSTGPHLHFEIRINGQPVDPVPYL